MADSTVSAHFSAPFVVAAPELFGLGFSVIPVQPGSKAPGEMRGSHWKPMSEWQRFRDRRATGIELECWLDYPDAGIGIVLGSVAGEDKSGPLQLVAIDIDLIDHEEADTARRSLPATHMSKAGQKGITLFYRASMELKSRNWRNPEHAGAKKFADMLTGRETRQTVCPPSIHPETNQPYRWVSGPAPLLSLPILTRDDLDAFEEQLEMLGWLRNPPPAPESPDRPARQSATRNLAAQSCFRDLNETALANLSCWVPSLPLAGLKRAGHGFRCVASWRASQSGKAEIERNSNCGIHPDGIRDFGTDETFTPIDLVMRVQNCEFSSAHAWLDEKLHGPLGDLAAFQIDDDLVEHCPEEDEGGELPAAPVVQAADLPRARGLVGAIAEWMTASAEKPQYLLSLAAALTIVGTAMGRQYAGPTNSGTHLYALGLAPTGAGKDHALKCAKRIMTAAGMGQHLGPGEFISSTAVVNLLTRSPLSLCLMDEFGAFLARINNRKAGGFEKAVGAMLRTAWGSSFSPFVTPEWAQKRSQLIHAPAMSIYGVSTPEEFFGALSGLDSTNGVLNRVLIFPSLDRVAQVKPVLDARTPPVAIVEGLKAIMHVQGGLIATNLNISDADPAGQNGYVLHCEWGEGGEAAYRDYIAEIEAAGERDHEFAASHSRAGEYAIRIATIHAVGRAGSDAPIRADDMEFGIAIARWSFGYALEASHDYIADTDAQARAQEIVRVLKKLGGKGTHRLLVQHLHHKYATRDVQDSLKALAESGRIRIEERQGRGPPSYIYTLQ